jgi:hypothetical protein
MSPIDATLSGHIITLFIILIIFGEEKNLKYFSTMHILNQEAKNSFKITFNN